MKNLTLILMLFLPSIFLPLSAEEKAPLTPPPDQTILNLKEVDIRVLVNQVADITGYNFIIDPRVKGKVTVISSKPMAGGEIYQVFLSILKVHGFSAVKNGNVVKVVPDSQGKQAAIPVGSDEKPIAGRGDEMVTRVMQVQNTTAHQLIPILRPLIPTYGHLAAYPPTNVVIISDRANNIDRLVNIIKQIDKASDARTEIIALQHASASEVVKLLENLQGERFERSREGAKTTRLAADTRTNSILVSGEESARKRMRELIAELDTPRKITGNMNVVFLNYAKAADLKKVLEGIKTKLAEESEEGPPSRFAGGRAGESVNIQADEATNALVITAPPDVQRNFQDVISRLDIRRAQVLVEAIIVELEDTFARKLGVQWGYKGNNMIGSLAFSNFGSSIAGTFNTTVNSVVKTIRDLPDNFIPVVGSTLNPGIGTLAGGDVRKHSAWDALVQFLYTDSQTNILSTPTLMTLDNAQAEIMVGEEVPFKIAEQVQPSTSGAQGTIYNKVDRKNVGVELKIKPHINVGGAITLEIDQQSNSLGLKVEDLVDRPTKKRSIKTTVLVEDGETIVLGGLISKEDKDQAQKVPLLGDIPVVGHLFKSNDNSRGVKNLMVFLRPSIVRESEAQKRLSKERYDYLRALQLKKRKEGIALFPDKETPLLPELGAPSSLPPSYESLYGPHPAPVEGRG
ncbi:MAG: type II secretion system secretin GspD [Gammaproteobacteria bacterium]|nr:type II secretion system secretin GspD [Gammaproteobacteria bacterium]